MVGRMFGHYLISETLGMGGMGVGDWPLFGQGARAAFPNCERIAFEWLEKAYQDRDEDLAWIKMDPTMKALRSDPRYADLLRRLRLG
jgi:hypothetical protein